MIGLANHVIGGSLLFIRNSWSCVTLFLCSLTIVFFYFPGLCRPPLDDVEFYVIFFLLSCSANSTSTSFAIRIRGNFGQKNNSCFSSEFKNWLGTLKNNSLAREGIGASWRRSIYFSLLFFVFPLQFLRFQIYYFNNSFSFSIIYRSSHWLSITAINYYYFLICILSLLHSVLLP